MPYLTISGEPLFYALHPSRESRSLAVVIIHGAGGNHLSWSPSLRRLSPTATTYLPDLPGHGRSGGKGRDSIDDYADVMREFCRALDLTSTIVVGHSMGGAIALSLALHYPTLCHKLVLLNAAPKFTVPPDILEALDAGLEQGVDIICQYAFSPQPIPSLIEATRRIMLDLPLETLRGDYQACQMFNVIEQLDDIRVPTLVIGAQDDLLTPPENQLLLAERICQAQLVLLQGSGHIASPTDQHQIQHLLLQFLNLGRLDKSFRKIYN